jgi:probable HAF family extracellular repeat protein
MTPLQIATLTLPNATQTQPLAINDTGQITGYYSDGQGTEHGFIYDDGNTISFDPPGSTDTNPVAINASGQVIGIYSDGEVENGVDRHGFLYSAGTTTVLDPPGSEETAPTAINASGQVVGYYREVAGFPDSRGPAFGFLYSDGTLSPIDVPAADATGPEFITDSREIVGRAGQHFGYVFIDMDGTYTTFEAGSIPTAVNASGQIVATDEAGGFSTVAAYSRR